MRYERRADAIDRAFMRLNALSKIKISKNFYKCFRVLRSQVTPQPEADTLQILMFERYGVSVRRKSSNCVSITS
jgi:hypothetical protein